MSHPAVFLDRDETIIDDPGFIDRPDQVRLQPGVAAAIGRFRSLGYKVLVVSNQSGVARGLISEDQLSAVHARLRQLLKERGVPLDAIRLAFKLALIRRRLRSSAKPLPPIRSLAYFRAVVLSLSPEETEPDYVEYVDQLYDQTLQNPDRLKTAL